MTDESSASVEASPDDAIRPAPVSCAQLFLVFTWLALHGFGGVLPWAQRMLVEERRWLGREEFVELLAFAQLLPGPNICNLALILGDRYFGWRGAAAALGGLMAIPVLIVLSLAMVHDQFAGLAAVRGAVEGMGAVAAGLILGTAAKLAMALRRRWRWLGFGLAAFVMAGLLRWPIIWTLAALVPVAITSAWWAEGRGIDRPPNQ